MTVSGQNIREILEKELLHSFCHCALILREQFARLETAGSLSFPILSDLVGSSMNKGPLWRLKDAAHNLFRKNGTLVQTPGAMLDWSLGYIFHEAAKLLEDARLCQAYFPRMGELALSWPKGYEYLLGQFSVIEEQTKTSILQEAARTQALIALSIQLFTLLFSGRADHLPLARLLHDHGDTVTRVFGPAYSEFVTAVYGERPEARHLAAARSLLAAGRQDVAKDALNQALQERPMYAAALELLANIPATNP